MHFILPGATIPNNIERLIEENTPVEHKVTLAADANPETIGIGSACITDLGCTTYFFKSCNAFPIYKPLDKMIGQSSMVSTNFQVLGMGTVEIKVIHDNVEHTLEFTNVLYAPDVTANLISISDGQGSACGLAGLRRGLTKYSCRGTSPVNLTIFLKGIGAEMNELHPHKV